MQTFWMQLKHYMNENGLEINITFKTSTFGVQEQHSSDSKLINSVILFAKYFIFKTKCTKSIPSWQAFTLYMKNRLMIEKEIALMKDKLREFQTNWEIVIRMFG